MEKAAFERVVHEWYDPLYRFAWSLCRDPDDALDLTQNAFHKLATHGEGIRDLKKVKAWLFSVLHRDFLDQYRRDRRFPSTTLDLLPEPAADGAAPPGRGEDTAAMLRALAGMEEKFRAPLTLFYMQSFSYKEIAEVLDIPMGTVMSRLRRAKDRLRERLESGAAADGETIPFRKEATNG